MKKGISLILFILMLLPSKINGQKSTINWITFKQLEDSLKVKPKKVFISFYADWCSYCKKMDRTAFKNDEVINILNTKYYAIRLNAETKDSISFEGKTYINDQLGKSRKPTHQIPLLLASRKGKPFSLPATIILNTNFIIENRYFEYLSPNKTLEIIK